MTMQPMTAITILSISQVFMNKYSSYYYLILDSDVLTDLNVADLIYPHEQGWQSLGSA